MRRDLAVCVFLVLVTLAVYGQVVRHDFVNIDDDEYVYENRHVRSGLDGRGRRMGLHDPVGQQLASPYVVVPHAGL